MRGTEGSVRPLPLARRRAMSRSPDKHVQRGCFLFFFCAFLLLCWQRSLKESASCGCRATGIFLKHARAFATVPSAYEQQKAALCRLRNGFFFGGFILSKQLNHTAATAVGDETTQMDGQVSSDSSAQCEKKQKKKSRNRLPSTIIIAHRTFTSQM